MLNRLLVISLSIALIPAFCKGAEKVAPKSKSKGPTIAQFINKVMAEGWEGDLSDQDARGLLGFPADTKVYGTDAKPQDADDEASRRFMVVLDSSTTTVRAQGALMRMSKKRAEGNYEGAAFRLLPDGQLERALTMRGTGVSGEAEFEDVDINSPSAKAAFQREMNFWLKGTGRKKKRPEKKAAAKK